MKQMGLDLAKEAGSQIISGGMGMLQEGLMGNRMRRKQREQQQAYTDMQFNANSNMLALQQDANKKMFDYTYKSAGDKKKELEEAGLNPALMYGGAMGGGGGSTAGGSGGSAGMGQEDEAGVQSAMLGRQSMGLQMELQRQQIKNLKAEEGKTIAEKENISEKTTTEIEQRDVMIEALKQQGYGNWLDNVRKDFLNKPIRDDTLEMYGNEIYGSTGLQKMSAFTQEVSAGIALGLADAGNAEAQALLNNERAKGYWTELLNAAKHADADAVKAAAIKLSAEWTTGEFTNWKTWVDTGIEGLNVLTNIVGAGAKVKGAKAAGKTMTTETNTTIGRGARRSVTRSYRE